MKVAAVAGEKGQAMEQRAACEGPPSLQHRPFSCRFKSGFVYGVAQKCHVSVCRELPAYLAAAAAL